MTFTDPAGLSGTLGVGGAVPGTQPDTGLPPLTPNAPSALKALNKKYNPGIITSMNQQFGSDLTNSLLQWELARAQRGVSPVNTQTTLNLLKAAQTHQAPTPAPESSVWDVFGNAANDVSQIVTGLPKFPEQVAHDILHAPEMLKDVSSGDINTVANAPIVRLIPGVHTISDIAQGNFSDLARHPVMTALDVAPFAHTIGLGGKIGALPIPGTEGLDVTGAIDQAKSALGRTMPGQFLKESFGSDTRDVSRILAEKPALVQQAAVPALHEIYSGALDQLRQQSTIAQAKIDTLVPDVARQGVLKGAIEDPQSVGATDAQAALDNVGATDAERAAVLHFQDARNAYTQYGLDAGQLTQRVMNGVPEVMTPEDAARLDKARYAASRVNTLASLRSAVLDPAAADVGALHDQVVQTLADPTLKAKDIRNIATGYVHALDVAGYDTGSLLRDLNMQNKGNMTATVNAIDHAALPRVEGDVLTRPARGTPALDSRTRWLDRNAAMTDSAAAKAQERLAGKENRVLPARWNPAFERLRMDAAGNYVEQTFTADDPRVPQMLDDIHQHMYADVPKDVMRDINKGALAEIANLRAQGIDPEFVHHVSPGQEAALASPSVTTIVPTASQWKARINDWTPTSDSLSVSLDHQGMELARADAARTALGEIRDAHTVPLRDAIDRLRPVAERIAARQGIPFGAALEQVMNKEYRLWSETENGFMAGRAQKFKFSSINSAAADDTALIPKHLANSLEMLASPPTYSRIFDPALRVFRTAVLPFSPRWFVHHIAGNMIAGLIEDPRFVKELPEAFAAGHDISQLNTAMRGGDFGYQLAPSTVEILRDMPESMRAQLSSLKYSVEPDQAFQLKAGGKLGELAHAAYLDRVGGAMSKAADFSYDFVNKADIMYRIADYLSGRKGGLADGLTPEEAGARGMALTNKIMPRWNEMTPMERSVFRVVFPFYGLMSHVFRYAMRFPVDHPWRTAVFANLARAEVQDFGTGLPQMLAGTFFLGSPDPSGGVTGVTVPTPFTNLGSSLTIAGLLGETNPLFKVVLQSAGYDPASHGPNLYPEVTYDPKTGKLIAKPMSTQGMLGTLATGLVPQANLLSALIGTSGDLRNLMQTNPDAAKRLLLSSAGVPMLWKRYNLNELAFSGEEARATQASKVLSAAMKSGDYSTLNAWPSLRPYIAQLQALQAAGKLTPYEAATSAAYTPPNIASNASAQVQAAGQANTQAEVRAG